MTSLGRANSLFFYKKKNVLQTSRSNGQHAIRYQTTGKLDSGLEEQSTKEKQIHLESKGPHTPALPWSRKWGLTNICHQYPLIISY